jgi:hypothetical protein
MHIRGYPTRISNLILQIRHVPLKAKYMYPYLSILIHTYLYLSEFAFQQARKPYSLRSSGVKIYSNELNFTLWLGPLTTKFFFLGQEVEEREIWGAREKNSIYSFVSLQLFELLQFDGQALWWDYPRYPSTGFAVQPQTECVHCVVFRATYLVFVQLEVWNKLTNVRQNYKHFSLEL